MLITTPDSAQNTGRRRKRLPRYKGKRGQRVRARLDKRNIRKERERGREDDGRIKYGLRRGMPRSAEGISYGERQIREHLGCRILGKKENHEGRRLRGTGFTLSRF